MLHHGALAGPRRAAPHHRRRANRSGDRHNKAGHRQRCGGASVKCATTSQKKSVQLFTTTSQPELEMITCGHLSNDLLAHCTTVLRLVMFRAACRYTNVPWGDCDPNSWMRTKTVSLIAEDRDR